MSENRRIELLGGLRLIDDDRVTTRFRTQKTAALLAFLAFHRRHPHAREVLIDLFWPQSTLAEGRDSLRTALSSLRRQLEPPGTVAGSLLRANRFAIELSDAIETDVAQFEKEIAAASRATASDAPHQIAALQRALGLYRGVLLPGFYDDWISLAARSLEDQFFHGVETLAALLEERGECAGALETVRRGLRHDSTNLEWQHAEQRLSTALSASVAPREAKTSGQPKTSEASRTSLPWQYDRFFGREAELAQLRLLLCDGFTRLVTLTGTGGCGKTRLSLQFAREIEATKTIAYDRICFVPLADIRDAQLLPDALSKALDLPRTPGFAWDQIAEVLAPGRTLLVFDNFEQIVDDGAAWVQMLLARAPGVQCVVSSRRRLLLAGECEVALGPLAVPGAEATSPEELLRWQSVQLFVDRARLARPDFGLTPRNAPSISCLCERLEGLPLALELVAARASVMTPAQMLKNLQTPLDVPADRRRGVPERHRTLAAAMKWSFDLLGRDLQRFFARVSVFHGGWNAALAQEICCATNEDNALNSDSDGFSLGGAALDYLAQLRNWSLVLNAETLHNETSEMRFRMLESLREFGAEQLGKAESEWLARRHAETFLLLAQSSQAKLSGPEQAMWLKRFMEEHDNFRAALRWATQHDPYLALRLATALAYFWEVGGFNAEGHAWMQLVFAAQSDTAEPLQSAENEDIEKRGDAMMLALGGAGRLAFFHGDLPAARRYFDRSIALARAQGNAAGIISVLRGLMQVLVNKGDFAGAMEFGEEALLLCREQSDTALTGEILLGLSATYNGQGDTVSGLPYLQEAATIFEKLGDQRGLALAFDDMAYGAYARGEVDAAGKSWQKALAIARDLSDLYLVFKTLYGVGNVARVNNDFARARAAYDESIRMVQEAQYTWALPYYLDGFGFLAAVQNQPERAAQLLGASDAVREMMGTPLLPLFQREHQRHVEILRGALGEELYSVHHKIGGAWSPEQAVCFALES